MKKFVVSLDFGKTQELKIFSADNVETFFENNLIDEIDDAFIEFDKYNTANVKLDAFNRGVETFSISTKNKTNTIVHMSILIDDTAAISLRNISDDRQKEIILATFVTFPLQIWTNKLADEQKKPKSIADYMVKALTSATLTIETLKAENNVADI